MPRQQTISVRAGEPLQAALALAATQAEAGDAVELRLAAGARYRGNFTIRNRGTGTITIRSDAADGNFAPGARPWIEPPAAEAMPHLESVTTEPVLTCEDGARGIRLFALDVLPNLAYPDRDLIVFGRDGMTSLAQVPDAITLDRCYVHGDAGTGQHRGLLFNVSHGTVRGCYFGSFMEIGRDSQAVAVWNGPGPLLFEDSFFEATGENFLAGGADPKIPNLVPSDLTFRGCQFFKPLEWMQTCRGSVKNLFELKSARRVLVDGCVFENNWPDAQDGRAIVLTVRSQDGGAPWSTVADVTIQYSLVRNIRGAAVSMLGLDDRPGIVTVQGTNMVLAHLLFDRCQNGFTINNGFVPTVIRHCTAESFAHWFLQFTNTPLPPGMFTCQNNVFPTGQYGIVGDGTGIGAPSLDDKAPGAIMTHNVIEQGNGYRVPLPLGNYEVGPHTIAARLDAGTYTGPEQSSTGLPMGADAAAIRARIPWAG